MLLIAVSTNAGDYHSRIDGADVPRASHNSSSDEQARLRVVWHAPRQKHDRLIVTGTLFIESKDGKSKKPIDWVQPVTVLISKKPNERPAWGKGYDDSDSDYDDCTVLKNGTFSADFHVSQINRTVGEIENFQVGLSLGEKYGTTMVWKIKPVLPQTIKSVRIAGPKPLTETQQIINAAPSISLRSFDPMPLIQAVNHLQPMGKAKAIAALRDFLKIANNGDFVFRDRDPANIDTSDPECVYPIVLLLFAPKNAEGKRPGLSYGNTSMYPSKSDESLWPYVPLAVHDDIPFLIAQSVGTILGGAPKSPIVDVEWADKHGTLRKTKLRPSDNPVDAADAFLSLPKTKRLLKKQQGWGGLADVRRQAWRMIEPLAGPPEAHNPKHVRLGYRIDWDWQRHKTIAKSHQIQWDATRQRYTGHADSRRSTRKVP